jgi:hypothetical protein
MRFECMENERPDQINKLDMNLEYTIYVKSPEPDSLKVEANRSVNQIDPHRKLGDAAARDQRVELQGRISGARSPSPSPSTELPPQLL